MKSALAVTSGGMDSISNGLMMLHKGYRVFFFHANLKHKAELGEKLACRKIVSELQKRGYSAELIEVNLPFFSEFSGASLQDRRTEIPLGLESIVKSATSIDELWTPARNVVLLAVACAYAEHLGAKYVTLGCNRSEQNYPDNTKTFLDRFTKMAEYGTIKIHPKFISPEWNYDKVGIIRWDFEHGFDWVLKWTWSCDVSPEKGKKREDVKPCGRCGCCNNRRIAFLISERLYGYYDPQWKDYRDREYFWKVFLPQVQEVLKKPIGKKLWFYKYRKEILEVET